MTDLRDVHHLGTQLRQDRATLRRELKSGKRTLKSILQTTPQCLESVPLYTVLEWLPHFGKHRVFTLNKRAMKAQINLFTPMMALTVRMKSWLIRMDLERRNGRRKFSNN